MLDSMEVLESEEVCAEMECSPDTRDPVLGEKRPAFQMSPDEEEEEETDGKLLIDIYVVCLYTIRRCVFCICVCLLTVSTWIFHAV